MSSAPVGPLGTILVLNGPNLNLLGTREPGIYGTKTLADIEQLCARTAEQRGLEARCVQSNHEGSLIDAIHDARGTASGIIINPAAYSHTSVAIPDALAGVELPVVEVHLSNIHRREEFRHHSYVSAVADVVIAGAGVQGYAMALDWMAATLTPAAAAD
ncbi:type II 3-dehydroquinate dehydratase [Arthrobacter castelli]|uniref:type II 3-dehydroquinate dehydratase n=1 Tax=Arthrobacter castelli TaxID=271431 RepID=UPI00047D08F7|nr:type II 3-dehydroquinate dehydratase [Arthrobacter castelli]